MNATTILVRRVKQGVAEWYRFQIKEKAWKGLREHALDGWNIGTPPYGYTAERTPRPVAVKAAQGRTKARLAPDPARAPVVEQVYVWRTTGRLGIPEITDRLNADPQAYPPPDGRGLLLRVSRSCPTRRYRAWWTARCTPSKARHAAGRRPMIWSPQETHPAIIGRATWDAAQVMADAHGTSRDGPALSAHHPQARRTYLLRGRVRCQPCQRRMYGATRPSTRYYAGQADVEHIYYLCRHDPRNQAHAAQAPDHPATVSVREDLLIEHARQFFALRVFGPDRAALLREQLPASATEDAARREKEAMRLWKRLDLETERDNIGARLAAMAKQADDHGGDPALLDGLPMLGDVLPRLPDRTKAQLFEALDLTMHYSKTTGQVTSRATITPATPAALAILLPTQDHPSDLARHPGAVN